MQNQPIYFLGIGGIGMSALAFYFLKQGNEVFGYDLTPSEITNNLTEKGAVIHFTENIEQIPENVKFVVYTPAISIHHTEYQYFLEKKIPILKRSEVLGMISSSLPTIAIAGTHGKTTTTALITHLLYPENDILSFIGGISKNVNSNFITSKNPQIAVVEADEYDRSFLTLHPFIAIITSIDADHLDIYGEKEQLESSFQQFANQIKSENPLIINELISDKIQHGYPMTYGFNEESNIFASNIHFYPNQVVFDLTLRIDGNEQAMNFEQLVLGVPGKYNLMNALAAITAVAEMYKATKREFSWEQIRKKLASFSGVKRRFDYHIYNENMVFVDDYAHHPEEIKSFLSALRTLFPDKEITGIFQPHLFSRTRDFAEEFARSLELLDNIILLDIYPAREEPIDGVTSQWLLTLIHKKNKIVLSKEALLPYLVEHKPQVLATLGAGDIDRLVPKIEQLFS